MRTREDLRPTLDLDIRMEIGRELRRMYADLIAEGVAERFAGRAKQ
jgi:hypothetical protein